MTEQEKQRIRKLFKSATNGLEYDRGVVLGSILGELMIKLDSTERELERLKETTYTKVYMDSGSNKRMLLGDTVQGWLERLDEDDMELTVGSYRVKHMHNYPFVSVKPYN